MTFFMRQIFGFVCSQNPAHTWAPGDELLPVCQRCTGLYVGAALALLLLLWFRPATDARYRCLHAALVLLMTPFGFHLLPHGAVLRTMSGQWFGFGVVGLLWLLPAGMLSVRTRNVGRNLLPYVAVGTASIFLLPLFLIWSPAIAAPVLSWLILAGLAAVCALLVGNLVIFMLTIVHWFRRHDARSMS